MKASIFQWTSAIAAAIVAILSGGASSTFAATAAIVPSADSPVAAGASPQPPPLSTGATHLPPELLFELPDSLSHLTPAPLPPLHLQPLQLPHRPALFDASRRRLSVVELPRKPALPLRVTPFSGRPSSFRVGGLSISNGQAHNWGIYPDALHDARTIIMPLPR